MKNMFLIFGLLMASLGCFTTMVLWARVEAYGWRDHFYKGLLLVNTLAMALAGAAMTWYSWRFM